MTGDEWVEVRTMDQHTRAQYQRLLGTLTGRTEVDTVADTPLADMLRGARERGPWIDEAATFDHAPFTAADSVRPERLWGGP